MNKLMLSVRVRAKSLLLFTSLAGISIAPAFAQMPSAQVPARPNPAVQAPRPVVQPPVAQPPVAQTPGAATVQPVPPPPPAPPLPPAIWDMVNAEDLLHYIQQIGAEGLNPADYDPDGLATAIRSGDYYLMSAAATQRFNQLSSDLALGHVKKPARVDWWIVDNDLTPEKQDALLRAALAKHDMTATLNGLLPGHPQYAALKAALAQTPAADSAERDRIRLNMDRWRWLPRELGQKYIIVNVPSFHATLVEGGGSRWKDRAIAGKLSTPTPQLSAMATGVILNPWWEVPKSIEKEAAGKKGFVPFKGADGSIQRWR